MLIDHQSRAGLSIPGSSPGFLLLSLGDHFNMCPLEQSIPLGYGRYHPCTVVQQTIVFGPIAGILFPV